MENDKLLIISSLIVSGGLLTVILVYFITIMIDISRRRSNNKNEKKYFKANPHMFYKDSLNFKSFDYINVDNEHDLYLIYFRQNTIVKRMFIIINMLLLLIIAIVIIVLIRSSYCGDDHTINIMEVISKDYIIILITSLLLFITVAFVHYYVHTRNFEKTTYEIIKTNVLNVSDISDFIYNNISRNDTFLQNLANKDIDAYMNIIVNEFKTNNREGIAKMIFTHALYNSYKRSENEKDFSDIKNIFTKKELINRIIQPAHYLQYKQEHIENTTNNIIDDAVIRSGNTIGNNIKNEVRRSANLLINNINEIIIKTIPKQDSINSVHEYLDYEIYIAISIVVFICAILLIYYFMKRIDTTTTQERNVVDTSEARV